MNKMFIKKFGQKNIRAATMYEVPTMCQAFYINNSFVPQQSYKSHILVLPPRLHKKETEAQRDDVNSQSHTAGRPRTQTLV